MDIIKTKPDKQLKIQQKLSINIKDVKVLSHPFLRRNQMTF